MSTKPLVIDESDLILSILNRLKQEKIKLWTWQLELNSSGKRGVYHSTITKIDFVNEIKTIDIKPTNTDGFDFGIDHSVFLYAESENLASKVQIIKYDPFIVKLVFPKSLGQMDQQLFSQLKLIEKENEELHLEQRSDERGKFKNEKIVEFRRFSEDKKVRHPLLKLEMYDLSKGGLSFQIDDPAEFKIGELINISKIDHKGFSEPTIGKIMNIREQNGKFKVGVMFVIDD